MAMALADLFLADGELWLELLRGTNAATLRALKASSPSARQAVDSIEAEVFASFPMMAFEVSAGALEAFGGDPLSGSSNLLEHLRSGTPIWRGFLAETASWEWAPAGVFSGQLLACSGWRQPPASATADDLRRTARDRHAPAWRQLRRSVWSSVSRSPFSQLPAGFGRTQDGKGGVTDTRIPPLCSGATGVGLAALDGQMYACGGWLDDDGHSSGTEMWVPDTNSWAPVPPRPVKVECRVWACGDAVAHQLYVPTPLVRMLLPVPISDPESFFSAQNDAPFEPLTGEHCSTKHRHTITAAAERFDPVAGQWEELPPMHWERADAAVAALGGRLYVCGGFVPGNHATCEAERFDPATGRWEDLPDMHRRRAHCAAHVASGRLVVCGGVDDFGRVVGGAEEFDPETAVWRLLEEPPAKS